MNMKSIVAIFAGVGVVVGEVAMAYVLLDATIESFSSKHGASTSLSASAAGR